jgi:hypothetical protein
LALNTFIASPCPRFCVARLTPDATWSLQCAAALSAQDDISRKSCSSGLKAVISASTAPAKGIHVTLRSRVRFIEALADAVHKTSAVKVSEPKRRA